MQIIPAILTANPLEMDELLRKIKATGKYDRVQIDFIDGEYATNKTFKPMEVDIIPFMPLKFDAHLMVTENNIVEWSIMARKFGFDRVIAQVESIAHPEEFTCLAMDSHSPISVIEPYLDKLELVLVMSVEPGFGGQAFIDAAKVDIAQLLNLRKEKGYTYKVCVDGGIDQDHLKILEEMGVDEVAVGAKRVFTW